MSGRIPEHDGPEDIDAAFAEIVADLEREGGLNWPSLDETETETETSQAAEPEPTNRREEADDDHFVPPEPPPLPPLRAPTVAALLLVGVGVLLLVVPGLVGLAPRIGTPLGLIALSAGIGWLVLRARQGPPPDSGWDDGAQV
ncbi:MAG TPA: hypothetical protein VIL00_15010 [Pseudonocardiaceae bacterium]